MDSLSTPKPWDMVAEGYAETTMKLFSSYIERALDLMDIRPGEHLADIACGPGTLSLAAAARGATVEALDFSPAMVGLLRNSIALRGLRGIAVTEGDGQNLPYAGATFDAAFSMFGLMFFPDRPRGHAELFRVLKPGGRVCVASWAPVDQSSLMVALYSAIQAINPDMPNPEPDMASLENPDVLKAELGAAGFGDVAVRRVSDSTEVTSAEAFWADMVRGAAPLRLLQESMDETAWAAAGRTAIDHLNRTIGPFPAELSMTAWLGTGVKPG